MYPEKEAKKIASKKWSKSDLLKKRTASKTKMEMTILQKIKASRCW